MVTRLIQIKAGLPGPPYSRRMSDSGGLDSLSGGKAEDDAMRARVLREQADWCVGMAAKVLDPRMFRAYVDAAAIYQEQAQAIESGLGLRSPLPI